ncbi:hypothetical protein SRABI128_03191 [Microbacterium sp. Bi128]|nr:hypothetical protein SRABI128_03191 [Microbacterium sp. Bi128]
MQFDLVDGRNYASLIDQALQAFLGEVGDANGLDPALLLELDEGLPGVNVFVLLGLHPVDQVQVQGLEAEPLHGFLERLQGGLVALVRVPQLGGDENFLGLEAGTLDGAAYACFVAVDLCRVDVAEAGLERLDNHLFGHVIFNLPHAVAKLGDGVAVIESQFR